MLRSLSFSQSATVMTETHKDIDDKHGVESLKDCFSDYFGSVDFGKHTLKNSFFSFRQFM